jgi:serine/threonine-protein phosphatase 2A regulatory subunit B'
MVYNAMKLFMEINPQLFDDCSHEYNEHQNGADEREKTRRMRWDLVAEQAEKRKQGILPVPPSTGNLVVADNAGSRADDVDPLTQDSQNRLHALKLQDDTGTVKEKGVRHSESQNSVSRT